MTTNFLKHLYLGSELTDEQMAEIPNYRAELHWHVMNKNLQVGEKETPRNPSNVQK